MAELVHLRLEHGLAELEEMERIGLFSRGEIHKIVKRRKKFEYRLRRRLKNKEDFLKYIEFEKCLLRLITKRRERLLLDSKKAEIDNSIAKKINRIYKAALSRFPEDELLWLMQIEYCKKMKWNDSINALYTKLLQVHSKKPMLYVSAAQWEIEDNHSFDNARKILQRGVLMNPKSELIWREYFRMELKYIDTILKRREALKLQNIEDSGENDAVLKGAVVNVVYDKATEEIEDLEFSLSFIQICLEFDFASKNIDYILKDVQKRFPDKEETLDALAKRPLIDVKKKIEKGRKAGIEKKSILKKLYEEIFTKYDEAVKTVPTEKMWNFYLDFLFDLMRSAKESKKLKLQASVLEKMEKAAEANLLSLDYYSHWIEMLFERGEKAEALSICLSAARKWNKVSFWTKCLILHIQCRKPKKVINLLITEALSTLKEKESLPIWKLAVEWLSISNPNKLVEFFETGITKHKVVSLPMKEMYLQTKALKGGVEAARELYNKFKKMGSLSLPIIRKMITIEKGQLKPPLDRIRKYYFDATSEFGATNIDIWLEYMHFEIAYANSSTLCADIHWQAMKKLNPELIEDFKIRITEYCTKSGLSTHLELPS